MGTLVVNVTGSFIIGFFAAFAREVGGIGWVHVSPKRGRAHNELTKYRYDAILEVGPGAEGEPQAWLDWEEDDLSLPQLRQRWRWWFQARRLRRATATPSNSGSTKLA